MISLEVEGLAKFGTYFQSAPERAKKAASLALNQTADRKVVPASRDLIMEQINFPAGYLNGERLYVKERANPNHLEATVAGRDRPTSLLRFASLGPNRTILGVTVGRRASRPVRRGFVIGLRSGNAGFAVRLKAGETLHGSRGAKQIGGDGRLWLLYGPSVNQAFLSVADELTPKFLDELSVEFLRQFARDNLL